MGDAALWDVGVPVVTCVVQLVVSTARCKGLVDGPRAVVHGTGSNASRVVALWHGVRMIAAPRGVGVCGSEAWSCKHHSCRDRIQGLVYTECVRVVADAPSAVRCNASWRTFCESRNSVSVRAHGHLPGPQIIAGSRQLARLPGQQQRGRGRHGAQAGGWQPAAPPGRGRGGTGWICTRPAARSSSQRSRTGVSWALLLAAGALITAMQACKM